MLFCILFVSMCQVHSLKIIVRTIKGGYTLPTANSKRREEELLFKFIPFSLRGGMGLCKVRFCLTESTQAFEAHFLSSAALSSLHGCSCGCLADMEELSAAAATLAVNICSHRP